MGTAVLASQVILFAAFLSYPAHAYVGPGAGLSTLGSVIAFLGVIVLLVAGFIWYPFKRMVRRNRAKKGGGDDASTSEDA